ncbi:ATP-dependent helicase [Heliophilum fasciatum]|uniref:DNA 3'-5' helicase n=1 Tax=Heliophilum fasciatum TaxID=35700 RepID=A0A4R2RIB7_9FIRM|nr:ATP-dependent helicase [Heliophilum fasciatum]MCW2278767.1 DNA helicase-2/ATP-dependent DNA helicase PcrA [Heliophilum fasciatum]TCP62438.1 Rep family ATP-dependent DNA helicase [Heliophilum fasciatum]
MRSTETMKRTETIHPSPPPLMLEKLVAPEAPLAETLTSRQLVPDSDPDGAYFRALEQAGMHLNRHQIAAVRHGKGPLLLLAGAGTGKTTTVVARVGYLLWQGVPAKRILLLTFTRKAAEEMQSRIARIPGIAPALARGVVAGTYHSIFLRLLQSRGYNQRILSSDAFRETIIKRILRQMKLQDSYPAETLLALFGYYKNNLMTYQDYGGQGQEELDQEIRTIWMAYEQFKTENHYIDFDDMMIEMRQLLLRDAALLQTLRDRFDFIFVDEYQDTTPTQDSIVKMIATPKNNLCVVGDDQQSIYGFRGAAASIIQDFAKEFPRAALIPLTINYRSTSQIVGLTDKVILHNRSRIAKVMEATVQGKRPPLFLRPRDSEDEAEQLIAIMARGVRELNYRWAHFVILYRTTAYCRAMLEKLTERHIPFVYHGGQESFYEQRTVKPVLDYLRLALRSDDLAAVEGILPSLYLNREDTMRYLEAQMAACPAMAPLGLLLTLPGLKEFQVKQIKERIDLIGRLAALTPRAAIRLVRQQYDKYMEADQRSTLTVHREAIREALDELETAAQKHRTVAAFLAFVEQMIAESKGRERQAEDGDAVQLMSIHKAKGLEFHTVFVIGLIEGVIPHSAALGADQCSDRISKTAGKSKVREAIEEECRICYVALTRAKRQLFISAPEMYRGKDTKVSRFVEDMIKRGGKKGRRY